MIADKMMSNYCCTTIAYFLPSQLIKDRVRDLYVGMRVVEMFDCTICKGDRTSKQRKVNKLDIYGKP